MLLDLKLLKQLKIQLIKILCLHMIVKIYKMLTKVAKK